ncbi:hypothetical protein RIF29_26708 [Crotalaria pallida]|uniref:Uncharacterized protein n=1 Tax=Crotalaria pallida TaxID=3830 RepID=A0AAN9I0H9_CROPI
MAKKRGRPPKTPRTPPPSSSPTTPPTTVQDSQNDANEAVPFLIDLLDEQINMPDTIDDLDENQQKALLVNIERLRAKIEGKVQEGVSQGLIPPERVNDDDLHPNTVQTDKGESSKPPKDDSWKLDSADSWW